jgi:hypothetical protein
VADQCVSVSTTMDGGWEVNDGLVRVSRAPLLRCGRSPPQFQNTMLGCTGARLTIEGRETEGRHEPGWENGRGGV